MHRALDCDDILLEILEHLNCPWQDATTLRLYNPYLPACARVCKTISVLALNILWKDVDGVKCLFKVLPSFRWDEHERCYKHLGNAPAGDMQRFKQYTDRIRVFTFRHTDKKVHSDSILQTFLWTKQDYMLPNLQSLTWFQRSPSDDIVMPFVVPSLRILCFILFFQADVSNVSPSISADVSTLLAKLLAVPTSLEELYLDFSGCNFPISPPPFVHVQRLRKVKLHLRWPTLTVHFLRTLSRLETLTELSVTAYSSDWDNGSADIGEFDLENSFFRLRYLSLSGSSDHLSFLLSVTSSPSIDYLKLDVSESDGNCHTFLSILRSKLAIWSATLRSVQLELQLQLQPDLHSWPQFKDYIRPLLGCQGLTKLEVRLPLHPLSFTDEDVAGFARAWPALVTFDLVGQFDAVPSFPAVADIFRRMPQLTALRMPWRIDSAGILALQTRAEPIGAQVEVLDLGVVRFDFDVSRAKPFGELLERLFPRLDMKACMGPSHRVLSPGQTEFLSHVGLAFEGARDRRLSLPYGRVGPCVF
ncbi:hypothetical protein B0H21DRAFT_730759 [Amylocystis lapponica]|nr:hypothetical protein B0H21DRAFT_730759 [Amylocystis lapponica]